MWPRMFWSLGRCGGLERSSSPSDHALNLEVSTSPPSLGLLVVQGPRWGSSFVFWAFFSDLQLSRQVQAPCAQVSQNTHRLELDQLEQHNSWSLCLGRLSHPVMFQRRFHKGTPNMKSPSLKRNLQPPQNISSSSISNRPAAPVCPASPLRTNAWNAASLASWVTKFKKK